MISFNLRETAQPESILELFRPPLPQYWRGNPPLYPSPQTRRYQEHSFGLITGDRSENLLAELGRFVVPIGSIGFIRGLDTYLDRGLGEEEGLIPSDAGTSWHVRIEPYYGLLPPQLIIVGGTFNQMPGVQVEIPDLFYQWYPARNAYDPLNVVIQGGSMARFFLWHPGALGVTIDALGRIRGYTQGENHNYGATENALGYW